MAELKKPVEEDDYDIEEKRRNKWLLYPDRKFRAYWDLTRTMYNIDFIINLVWLLSHAFWARTFWLSVMRAEQI